MSTARVLLRLAMAPGGRGLLIGGLVAVIAAAASIALVATAGWLVTASAVAGIALAAGAAMTLDIFAPSALIRLLAVTRTVGRYAERLVLHATIFRLVAWLRVRIYRAWARFEWQSLRRQGRAAGLNRLMDDVGALETLHPGLLVPLFALVVAAAGFAVVGGVLAGAAVGITVGVLLVFLAATVVAPALGQVRRDARVALRRERFRIVLVDVLGAVNALHFADPGGRVRDALLRLDARCHRGAHAQAVRAAIAEGFAQYAVLLAAAAVIVVAASVAVPGPAVMTLAALGMLALGGLVAGLPEAWHGFARLWLAARRLGGELTPGPGVHGRDDEASRAPDPLPTGWRLDDVVISRSATGARVLDGLSLTVRPGERICITGTSGAGKSTLLEVLMGMLAPTAGHAWCDGQPLDAMTEHKRVARATLLTQATVVLSGSVASNLRVADSDLADDAIEAVIAALGLARVVDARQWIGRHGATLSGGEARRIALARAVLRRTGALLLDEPFRGLDAKSRERSAMWLSAALRGRTLVLCDHAKPAGIGFDRVLVLRDGRLHDVAAGV